MSNDLEAKIEAVLFFKGEPVSLKKLGDILKVSPGEMLEAIASLKVNLENRGISLMENNNEFALATAHQFGQLIENLQKEELNKGLSKATLETMSIILYKGGASRAEIDYIRGVNSSFTLRALSVRGLVEKTNDERDSRRYIYKPSFDTLSYLGVRSVEELPEWQEVKGSLESAAKNLEELSAKEESSPPNA
ncbi:MAG: SMC-Scp complex subunit ScpB [bacterium]|nr:SMC-Scp complex subunit ScpB [bacterium]